MADRISFLRHGFALIALSAGLPAAETTSDPYAEALFARRVWPLLQEKCVSCHGRDEDKIKGGLDLRTFESAMVGGDSTEPPLIAGRPDESPLFLAASRNRDDWEAMPPKDNDALSAEQLADLKQWIEGGAPWPSDARRMELLALEDPWSVAEGVQVRTIGGLAEEWTNRRYKPEDLWAYQPLVKPPLPENASATDPIDGLDQGRHVGLAPIARTVSWGNF